MQPRKCQDWRPRFSQIALCRRLGPSLLAEAGHPHLIGFNRPLFIYPEITLAWIDGRWARGFKLAIQKLFHRRLYLREADCLLSYKTDDVNAAGAETARDHERTYQLPIIIMAEFNQPAEFPPRLPRARLGYISLSNLDQLLPAQEPGTPIPEIVRVLPDSVRDRVEFVLNFD